MREAIKGDTCVKMNTSVIPPSALYLLLVTGKSVQLFHKTTRDIRTALRDLSGQGVLTVCMCVLAVTMKITNKMNYVD